MPNYRLIAARDTMPDNSLAMLQRSTPPDPPPRSTNQFDVAIASIKQGQHPVWTYLYMRQKGFSWAGAAAAITAIGALLKSPM